MCGFARNEHAGKRSGSRLRSRPGHEDSNGKSIQLPDIVFSGIGFELICDIIKAAELVRALTPALRVRVANASGFMALGPEDLHLHPLSNDALNAFFTADDLAKFNYHGYPAELKGLLFSRSKMERVTV